MIQNLQNKAAPIVSILISTYNGENHIRIQIDSILKQTYENINIIVRDDGSTDRTLEILEEYKENNKNRIKLIKDSLGNIGSTRSFFELLKIAPIESYYMCSDQDDYWFVNKVEMFLKKIQELERINQVDQPILVFGNMTVTDEKFRVISESFWDLQKINPCIIFNWKKVLSQNVVTGCSIMINSDMKSLFKDFPNIEMHHDHFLAIKASQNGIVDYIKTPTMYYVQHRNNVVGASSYNIGYVISRIKRLNKTLVSYYKLCKYFDLCFLQFIYYKIAISVNRFYKKK